MTAAAVGLAACALLFGPVLFFGTFALRSALAEQTARSADDRDEAVALAAALVSRSMVARGELLRDLSERPSVVDALRRRDRATLTRVFENLLDGRPEIATAGAIDPTGVPFARVPDANLAGRNFAADDYFMGAMQVRDPFIGAGTVSTISGKTLIPVAIAVRDGADVVGVLALTIMPSALLDDLQAILGRNGRELVLVDGTGATLASTAGRAPLGQLGLAAGSGIARVDGAVSVKSSGLVPATTWTLHVLDDVRDVSAGQRAALAELGGPLFVAIVASGLIAAVLAIGFLVLRRERAELAAANARLSEMNVRLEGATRAKSDFLASMSHELRTPLNAVLGFSDVLEEQLRGSLTDRQMRYLANIRMAGQHLLELINDVLDLSKVEAGRLELRLEPIAIVTLVEPVVASVSQLAADRKIHFTAPALPDAIVLVDPARIRQVLLNLLSNAVKFTPANGDVSLEITADAGALRFDVTDTGIGIPLEQRDRVFGMFERLHEGRSDAEGTGLGLAITKKLVELHRGTIDFDSVPGRGTRFWVLLPDAVVDVPSGPRVLVIEDDRRDAELLVELARESGIAVEVAPTAASAFAAIARSAPTAVILDLRLPDRRGDDILRALKAEPTTARIPVLVVSVEDDDGRARLLGASDHVTKPIDPERVRRWLAPLHEMDDDGVPSRDHAAAAR